MSNNLAQYFDHTILNPDATRADVKRICEEAIAYKTADRKSVV